MERQTCYNLQSKHTSISIVLVLLVFLYGAECCALRKEDKYRICTAEIGWKRKTNWHKQKAEEQR